MYVYFLIPLVLSFFGYLRWFKLDITALEGPGIDLINYYIKSSDPLLLANDFFTNASMQPSPKHVFGDFLLGLAKVFSTDWYGGMFLIKTFFVLVTGPLWFWALLALAKRINARLSTANIVMIFFFVSWATLDPYFPNLMSTKALFSVAWWPTYIDNASPQTLAQVLALTAIAISGLKPSPLRLILKIVLYWLATLVHPIVSLAFILLETLVEASVEHLKLRSLFKNIAFVLLYFLPPSLCLVFLFKVRQPLDLTTFKYAYVYMAGSSHFSPRHFGSFSGHSWMWSALLVVMLLIGLSVKNKSVPVLRNLAIAACVFYTSSILFQFAIAEMTLPKFFIVLGTSRFTFLGFWMIVLVLSSMELKNWLAISNEKFLKPLVTIFLFWGLTTSLIYHFQKDQPLLKMKQRYESLGQWIQQNTSPNSVFAAPFHELTNVIPWAFHRSVYAGIGFPFTETEFKEYVARESALYGSFEERMNEGGSWIGESMSKFYRKLTPQSFRKLSTQHQLDYYVVEAGHDDHFNEEIPVYSDHQFKIFKVQ